MFTIRPYTGASAALDRARQCAAAKWVVLKWPFRWTRITESHSSSDIEKTIRSRRMPALLTRMSSCPNSATANSTSSRACWWSATSPVCATARPPAARISAATSSAGVGGRGAGAVPAGLSEVVDDDGGAEPGQLQRLRPAQAAARTRDDRGPALKWQ